MHLNRLKSTGFSYLALKHVEEFEFVRVKLGVALFVAFFRSHEAPNTYKTHTLVIT